MNKYLILITCCVFILSCKTKKEVVTEKTSPKQLVSVDACADVGNDLSWTTFIQENNDSKIVINGRCQLLSVNARYLDQVMIKKFQNTESHAMTFPLLINGVLECKKFELQNSNTLSREKQKEMKLFSFRGSETENSGNTIRVDYSLNTGLKAYAFIDEGSYLIEPVMFAGKRLYITYDKKDSGELKDQFEIND